VANAVTNPRVRAAVGDYLAWLGTQIPHNKLLAVRQGGGPTGELRYPDATYNGHTNSYWAYDASTQYLSPVPGWKPGTGTAAQARLFLDSYNKALNDYGIWLNGEFAKDFAGTSTLLMMPGWGERPGIDNDMVNGLLTDDRPAYNEGLDWANLVPNLPDQAHTILYTTYLDAPAGIMPTVQFEDPVAYVASLASLYGMRMGGENTGRGTDDSLTLTLTRARDYRMTIVNWMDEEDLEVGNASSNTALVSFADLKRVFDSVDLDTPVPPAAAPPPSPPATPLTDRTSALLGVLSVGGARYSDEAAAGIKAVTINASWRSAEPTNNGFSASYASQLNLKIDNAIAAGMQVIIDPGIHYPPDWVFTLPGGTRFVNQYGDTFTGAADSGMNIANTVTNPDVRAALAGYLAWLGKQIPKGKLLGIRQSGGQYGQLRYPDASYNGHTNSWWAYDTSTQAQSPVPGWKPGTGTTTQAQQFLDNYNRNLVNYGVWLNNELSKDFATTILLVLPGFGERPGQATDLVNSRLTNLKDSFNQGLDWANLIPSLADPAHTVVYTTWLDAPDGLQNTVQLEDPVHYLAALANAYGLRLGGQNSASTDAALSVAAGRAKDLDMVIFNWASESTLVTAGTSTNTALTTFADLSGALG
jgi:hypothetical protein